MATSTLAISPRDQITSCPYRARIAAMCASCTLGTSRKRRLSSPMMRVTREKGRRREPYPPTTVSFVTNPSRAGRSTSNTRMYTPSCTDYIQPQETKPHGSGDGWGRAAGGGHAVLPQRRERFGENERPVSERIAAIFDARHRTVDADFAGLFVRARPAVPRHARHVAERIPRF